MSVKIALVDDHTLLRNGIASIISSDMTKEFTVHFEASNGKDFINKLKEFGLPDIVLLDINMPEMNGFETVKWLKKNQPGIKIIILTVMDDPGIVAAMMKEGVHGYLTKDARPDSFHMALKSVAANGHYYDDFVTESLISVLDQIDFRDNSMDKTVNDISQLTENEIMFLQLSCSELTYKEIAEKLKVSVRTVDGYRDTLLKKLNVQSRVGLVVFAIKHGLYKL